MPAVESDIIISTCKLFPCAHKQQTSLVAMTCIKNEMERKRKRQIERDREWCCSLKISIMIFAKGLQDDGDDSHDGFDNAELQSRLENTLQFRIRH